MVGKDLCPSPHHGSDGPHWREHHPGPRSTQHPGSPSLPARVPARQQKGCRRSGSEPSFHILPVSLLCHTSLFFFFFPSPLSTPPSSQKGWFISESLKHICIPKTSLGINSSRCRVFFLFFYFLPILPLFLPSPFLSKPKTNSARTLASLALSHCTTRDYKGSEGFPFLLTHGVQCCCLVLLLTIRRDKALSPIRCTNLLPTFLSSQPWPPRNCT